MIRAIAVACLCAGVLLTSVFARFDPVRVKVVRESVASRDGVVRVPMPARADDARVIIARVRNDAADAATVAVTVDGVAIDARGASGASGADDGIRVEPRSERRVDLALPSGVALKAGSTIELRSAGDAWSLRYLEVANIHGASTQLLKFVIVPAGGSGADASAHANGYARVPMWVVLVTLIVVLGLSLASVRAGDGGDGSGAGDDADGGAAASARWLKNAYVVASSIVITVFLIALLSGLLTRFKVLLAPDTFVLCTLLLTIGGVKRASVAARDALLSFTGVRAVVFDSLIVALVILTFYVCALRVMLEPYGGNVSGVVQIAKKNADRFPPLTERPELKRALILHDTGGYDGQFAYFITFDPFLTAYAANPERYRDFIDAPPYRYRRIGFSLLTKVVSGNRAEWYPGTMVALVLAAHVASALLLASIFARYGRSPYWALLYLIVPGFMQSLQSALPESIAGAGLLGGYWLWLRSRPWPAAALLAAAILVRETSIFLVIALVLYELLAWWRSRSAPATASALTTRNSEVTADSSTTSNSSSSPSSRSSHSSRSSLSSSSSSSSSSMRSSTRAHLRIAIILASSSLGLALWRLYVAWRLFSDWKWQGLFFNPSILVLPGRGFLDLWRTPGLSPAGVYFPLVLLAAFALAIALFWNRRDALTGATAAYALVAVSLDYPNVWSGVANGERATYELPLLLITTFATLAAHATTLRRASLTVFLIFALYQLFTSEAAAVVRTVVGL